MSQTKSVRREAAVLIVEDRAPMREAIRACIEGSYPGLSIIEAPDGATALKVVEAHEPSLVLMDINLPDANGLDLTRDIVKQWPGTLVAVLSIETGADLPERVRAAGAVEFISKYTLFKTLFPLVGAAASLKIWMKNIGSHCANKNELPLYG